MDETHIVIIGANGQLGKALQAKYPKARALARSDLDITNWDRVSKYDWSNVNIILNTAVYAKVDEAETTEGRVAAWRTNATGVGYLAKIAAKHDIILVHFSSDYVFDGTKNSHTEDEPFAPINVYGQSKAAGDIAASSAPKHYIFRITWLIGDGGNFVRTMIGLASKNISPTVVNDQIGRLTFVNTLASIIDQALTKKPPFGTYNASGEGEPASWADITRTIFQELGRSDLTVTNTTTKDYFASKPEIAPRPLRCDLDLGKLKEVDISNQDWRKDLHNYIKAEQASAKES